MSGFQIGWKGEMRKGRRISCHECYGLMDREWIKTNECRESKIYKGAFPPSYSGENQKTAQKKKEHVYSLQRTFHTLNSIRPITFALDGRILLTSIESP